METAPTDVPAVLVDTDVFSFLMKPHDSRGPLYSPHVKGKRMCVAFITVGELLFGAFKRKWGARKIDDLKRRLRSVVIVPYDSRLCYTYADLKVKTTTAGRPRPDNDLWIAACAIRHSIPLVSHNRSDFEGIPGLVLISESQVIKEIRSQLDLPKAITPAASNEQEPPS